MADKENQQIFQSLLSDVKIRTMESDMKAIKSSGGDLTSLQLSGILKDEVKISEPLEEEVKIKLGVPGYTGPEQAIFAPKGEISEGKNASSILKIFFLIMGIVIVVAGIGFLAYYLALNILK